MEHDHAYKLLFSHPQLVADLLRGFVREDWVRQLDFSTLEPVSGHYVSDDLRERKVLLDEGSFKGSELAELRNLAAALFRLENSREPQDVERVLTCLLD